MILLKLKPLHPFLDTLLRFSHNPGIWLSLTPNLWRDNQMLSSRRPFLRPVEIITPVGTERFLEVVMKRFFVVLLVVVSMFLAACSFHADKAAEGPDGHGRLTASGYTQEGCLLNLKLAARERNVRLAPDDLHVETNSFMLLFPFLNHEGYRCSASFTEREKRPLSKDPLYPFD